MILRDINSRLLEFDPPPAPPLHGPTSPIPCPFTSFRPKRSASTCAILMFLEKKSLGCCNPKRILSKNSFKFGIFVSFEQKITFTRPVATCSLISSFFCKPFGKVIACRSRESRRTLIRYYLFCF